jgi:hypothetical protein
MEDKQEITNVQSTDGAGRHPSRQIDQNNRVEPIFSYSRRYKDTEAFSVKCVPDTCVDRSNDDGSSASHGADTERPASGPAV